MMTSKSVTRQIAGAYRQADLTRILTLREDRFARAFGLETVITGPGQPSYRNAGRPENYYHFRDNGSRVLAVAHLDTVVSQNGRIPYFRDTKQGPHVVSGALDDRLGAYVILHLLPAMGITCDWLLTVGEESGASTAEHFKAPKDYDHVIEFDRTGTDVVMYQYEDEDACQAVEAAGAKVGEGSFSDIAYLEHLGVKAFNWGVGYRGDYHSEAGYAFLEDTFAMVGKYLRFHEQNAGVAMPHDPDSGYYGGSRARGAWDCAMCLGRGTVSTITGYCDECGACMDCGEEEGYGCMCYVPAHIRDEAREARGARDGDDAWRQMSWDEYTARRPADAGQPDEADKAGDDTVNHVACIAALAGTPGAHTHPGMAGWWVSTPAARRRSPSIAPPWSEHAPDRDASRHEAAKSRHGWYAGAHDATPMWANVCDRCAARWPDKDYAPVATDPAEEADQPAIAIVAGHDRAGHRGRPDFPTSRHDEQER